jgi:hypothetical protein
MPLTPVLFLKARPVGMVAVVALLTSVGVLLLCNAKLPATTPDGDSYNAAVTFTIAPALVSAIALALLGSRLHTWENLAVRGLSWRRLAVGVLAIALAVAMLLPSAPRAVVDQPVQVVVQGVLACSGIGMLASRYLAYPGQASITFLYGLVGFNTSWALHGPAQALLAIGAPATRAGLTVAVATAAGGLAVQATRSSRLVD